MSIKTMLTVFKAGECSLEEIRKESFMIQDTIGVLQSMNKPETMVVSISNYNGTQEQKESFYKDIVSWFKDDVVVLASAGATMNEFPETEYYDSNAPEESEYVKEAIKNGKKPIPFDEVIARESKLLESIGFKDFNGYVNYEYSKAYLYGNDIGKEILEFVTSLK